MSVAQVPVVVIVLGISPPLVGRLRFQYPAGISCSDRTCGDPIPCPKAIIARVRVL